MKLLKYAALVALFAGTLAHAADWRAVTKKSVTDQLKDPNSAIFTDMVRYKSAEKGFFSVCGYVNAKNSYGGYVGKKKFYAIGIDSAGMVASTAYLEDDDGSQGQVMMDLYGGICRNGWKKATVTTDQPEQ